MTKRGRGQRRSRRLKNRDLDEAQRRAAQHIRYNYRNKASRQVWDTLVHYFRELTKPTKTWRMLVPPVDSMQVHRHFLVERVEHRSGCLFCRPAHVDCDCMSCRPG